jgi:hypothetical protein
MIIFKRENIYFFHAGIFLSVSQIDPTHHFTLVIILVHIILRILRKSADTAIGSCIRAA